MFFFFLYTVAILTIAYIYATYSTASMIKSAEPDMELKPFSNFVYEAFSNDRR